MWLAIALYNKPNTQIYIYLAYTMRYVKQIRFTRGKRKEKKKKKTKKMRAVPIVEDFSIPVPNGGRKFRLCFTKGTWG